MISDLLKISMYVPVAVWSNLSTLRSGFNSIHACFCIPFPMQELTPSASSGKLLVTTGGELAVWEPLCRDGGGPPAGPRGWRKSATVIVESRPFRRPDGTMQRRFISAVTELWGRSGVFGAAVFDGSISIVDVQAVRSYHEHQGRVLAFENLREHMFASCADDGCIKVWDLRAPSSARTIRGGYQQGRVSQLLLLSDNCFVSACCDDAALHGGKLSFWDMRVL